MTSKAFAAHSQLKKHSRPRPLTPHGSFSHVLAPYVQRPLAKWQADLTQVAPGTPPEDKTLRSETRVEWKVK